MDRPTGSTDADELVDWLGPMSGMRPGPVHVELPPNIRSGLIQMEEYHDEVGFAISEVDAFVSWSALPIEGTVWAGDLDVAATTKVADGVVTLGTGDDHEIDFEGRTAARPLGTPLRFAEAGGLVLTTSSSDLASAWLDPQLATLDDDPAFVAAAELLDERGVLSAAPYRNDFSVWADGIAEPAAAVISEPFDTVAIGWGVEGRGAVISVVYVFGGETAAAAAVSEIETAWTSDSGRTGQPIADGLVLDAVDVTGAAVVATLSLTGAEIPSVVLQMRYRLDSPFVHQ